MIRPASLALILTLILPSAFFVMLSASSMNTGLLAAAAIWTATGLACADPPWMLRKSDASRSLMLLGILVLLALHAAVASHFVPGTDYLRLLTSCAILLVVCIGAHFAALTFARIPPVQLVNAASFILLLLAVIAAAAMAGVPALGPQTSTKPIVIFSEPSHFALAFLPMLLFRIAVARRTTQFWLISAALLLAAAMESLTMVAGILIVSALLLRRAALVTMALMVVVAALTLDVTYYSYRLTFSSDTTNISTLVFMQGWENAYLDMRDTNGFGVGFQQFGVAGSVGDFADRIAELLGGDYINLLDGGSTATKLIGEFGFFGLLGLLAYMRVAFQAVSFLRAAQLLPPAARDRRSIFLYSLIISFTFELLIRGLGYFSSGGFLALAALLSIHRLRKAANTALPATTTASGSEAVAA